MSSLFVSSFALLPGSFEGLVGVAEAGGVVEAEVVVLVGINKIFLSSIKTIFVSFWLGPELPDFEEEKC